MNGNTFVPKENAGVWDTISKRLAKFSPAIKLTDYIAFDQDDPVRVKEYATDGIDFLVTERREKFKQELKSAKTSTGSPGFDMGSWKGTLHAAKGALRDLGGSVTGLGSGGGNWARDITFKATRGVGFREIWYLELPERELRIRNPKAFHLQTPKLDSGFSAMFEAPNRRMDLSSLHFAVPDPDKNGVSVCNVHIDQVGIDANLGFGNAVTPDFPYHTLVELAFRTGLKGLVPNSILQSVDFIMPSSHENYALNFGAQINIIDRKDLNLNVRGMCALREGRCEWSGTLNLSGTHDWFGSK